MSTRKENNSASRPADASAHASEAQDSLPANAPALSRSKWTEGPVRNVMHYELSAPVNLAESAGHRAMHDHLTDLPNGALFNDRLEIAIAQARHHGWSTAVLLVHMGGLKLIGQTFGQAANDCVVKELAARLTATLRFGDTISRHGGSDFLCLLCEIAGEQELATIATELNRVIRQPCECLDQDVATSVHIRPSIGIAVFPQDGDTADRMIGRAAAAMRQADGDHSGFAFASSMPNF